MDCRVRVEELLKMKIEIEIKTGKVKRGRALPRVRVNPILQTGKLGTSLYTHVTTFFF